jgi:large subunit ribosomal protein L31e
MADKLELVKAMVYVVPLSRIYWGRRTNRADRAVKLVRSFVARHTKADRVLITNELNNYIWSRSREKPPRRVRILVTLYKEKLEEEEEKKEVVIAKVRLAPKDAKPGPYTVKGEGKVEAKSE